MNNKKKKILGLILELNPPHNGHKYFIDEAKKKVKPDVTIAIISSSFTMRGDISVVNKWDKAKIALKLGVDIVLDMPFISAVNSADFFALNAVKTLLSFNITDIAFGVELDDLDKLKKIISFTSSINYNNAVKEYLKYGHSYSGSTLKAFLKVSSDEELINNFTLPNNTLAMQYIKVFEKLNYDINYTLIKRVDNNYYDTNTTGILSSATSIRQQMKLNNDISSFIPINFTYINENEANKKIYDLLKYKLISSNVQDTFGIKEGIENRLLGNINQECYDEFIEHVKTKRYSVNYLKRIVLHIIMETPKKYENKENFYLRILAFSKSGEKYIKTLDESIKKEIITSFKNTKNEIALFEEKVSRIYSVIIDKPNLYLEEFKVPYKEIKNDD